MHQLVTEVVEDYLKAADTAVPGLIEGLYLEGSVALDDFHPHASDIDFVAITSDRLAADALAALRRLHDGLRRRPRFDGVYLTWTDLARGPAATGSVPHAHEGRFHPVGRGDHNPVTWHTLARHGIACRGPRPADVDLWTDPVALASWTDGNLDRYWRRWLNRASRLPSTLGLYTLTPDATVWVVTGVTRLHYTLATGEITSKTGAGRYAKEVFPERWHQVLHEALRIRHGDRTRSQFRSRWARRRDLLAFGDVVIADAHRLYNGRSG